MHRKTEHPSSATLLGHPRALGFLFATEMWERFSYYGMRALLVLYMVKYLLHAPAADTVLGLSVLRGVLESVFGPLSAQAFASHIYGFYTGFVYLTPVLGGYLADRWLGPHRMVILGAALMAAGHFLMAFEHLFLLALLLLIFGNGAFKPNIAVQLGALYSRDDPRRDRAFSIFYVGINLGAFLAPLICGTLGETYGWHYGFTAAGIGMTLALVIYLAAVPILPRPPRVMRERAPLTADDRARVIALLLLVIPVSLFWMTYEQQGNTIALFADGLIDRSIGIGAWRIDIPVTWFQALNPLMIFAFTPLIVGIWAAQASRKREPTTIRKMAIGCALCAVSYAVLTAATYFQVGENKIGLIWVLAYFTLITVGELYLSPTGLSLVSRVAPASLVSLMMGLWLVTNFAGNLMAGWLGSLWSTLQPAQFFALCAALSLGAAVLMRMMESPIRRRLGGG
jgi:POT family proton-dependent oligopeptide transporter